MWVRVWVKPNFESPLDKTKTPQTAVLRGFCGAAIQIRTGDLILTKDVLYHLSHSSIYSLKQNTKTWYSSLQAVLATRNGLEPSTSSVTG